MVNDTTKSRIGTMMTLTDDEVREIHKQFTHLAWIPSGSEVLIKSIIAKCEAEMKRRKMP